MSREGSLLLSLFFPKEEKKKKNQTLSSGLYRLSLPTKGVGIPFRWSGVQSQICVSCRVPESEATLRGACLLRSVHLGEEMLILTAGIIFPREGMLLRNVTYGTERVGCPPDLSISLPKADNPIINSPKNGTRNSSSLKKIRIMWS